MNLLNTLADGFSALTEGALVPPFPDYIPPSADKKALYGDFLAIQGDLCNGINKAVDNDNQNRTTPER